jgi:hypothetical protein
MLFNRTFVVFLHYKNSVYLCIYDLFHIVLALWHTYGFIECMYVCVYVCMYVCMHVCLSVCMCVCTYVCI